MTLVDWRGDAVIPEAWLEGYLRLHPIHREPSRIGGPEQQRRAAKLDQVLNAIKER